MIFSTNISVLVLASPLKLDSDSRVQAEPRTRGSELTALGHTVKPWLQTILLYRPLFTSPVLFFLVIESNPGENFLSLQCKDKGEGGCLKILLVKIAIHKGISMPMPNTVKQLILACRKL